jgi:peptide deformylase
MVRTVLLEGDPLIRKTMPNIDAGEKAKIKQIINDLRDTMFATNSIGFAANQIGEPYNICIVRLYRKYITGTDSFLSFINPYIVVKSGVDYKREGCRSIPDYWASIPRSTSILVAHQRGTNKLLGWQARIAQHEIDHLNGILIRDYVEGTHGKKGGYL